MGKIVNFKENKEAKIPEGMYCNGCPYHEYVGTDYLLRDLSMKDRLKEFTLEDDERFIVCPHSENCTANCISGGTPNCSVQRVRCKYMNYQDDTEDTLLWDKVKECGINKD